MRILDCITTCRPRFQDFAAPLYDIYIFLFLISKNVKFQEHGATVFCELCNQGFRTKEKLRVHKINKHLEDEQKPYVCSICGKGYAHKTKLESHQMNVHIRSRPFKCRADVKCGNYFYIILIFFLVQRIQQPIPKLRIVKF